VNLPILITVGLAIVALILVVLKGAGSQASPTRARTPAAKRRLAKRMRSQGKSAKAGELFQEAGDLETALETFLTAGLLARAAPIMEELGDLHAALEAYEAGGQHRKAGGVAEQLRDPIRAAQHYEMAKAWKEAARCWMAGGHHARAGSAWWKEREYARAAESFERAGRWVEAGKIYRLLLDAVRKGDGGEILKKTYDPAELGKRAGRCYSAAGQRRQAADCLALGGLFAEAATTYEAEGALVEAAGMTLRLGQSSAAADLLEQAGRAEQAAAIRARLNLEAGEHLEAAQHLEQAGDLEGAARVWSQLGEHARAAALYEHQENWVSAAMEWMQASEPRRAAQAWERAGDPEQAVELYRTAGDVPNELRLREAAREWVRAGELRLLAGDLEGAEHVLKQVSDEAEDRREACRLLGDVYRAGGNAAAAAVKYRQAVEEAKPTAANAESFYWAGVCSFEAKEHKTALSLLLTLRELDPTYRDIQARLEEVQRVVAEELVRSGTAPGRYERKDKLGQGGMGAVYRAKDLVLNREVALKLLPPKETGHPKAREWFLREARSAAVLNHPNIVTIYDFGEVDGDLFIAMECVEGCSLKALFERQGPLDEETLYEVFIQACDALIYAHARGVIHRDVKPANLMWTPERRMKIADFGLAKMMSVAKDIMEEQARAAIEAQELESYGGSRKTSAFDTSQSRVFGTPAYMSPEQIRQSRISPSVDQYSLGVTLFELATGQVPFSRGNILRAHLSTPPPKPSSLRADLPEWLETVILRCLQKRPADRFEDLQALQDAVPH